MLCPIGNHSGLITLTGGIAPRDLTQTTPSVNELPVETLTFPVRSTPPTRSGTFIDEVNPEQNICKVDGNKGELNRIQICKETHTGYQLPGNKQKPLAELIFSFYVTKRSAGSGVIHGILLCLPIYEAIPSQQNHHEYLTALMNGSVETDARNFPSLSSLFYSSEKDMSQVSLSYKTCVEVTGGNNRFSTRSLSVHVFPHGIHIASNVLQPFLANNPLQRFQLSSAIRNGNATASNYRFNNEGIKEITETSSEGFLYTTSMNSCHEEFKNRFQYFVRPPPIPSISKRINAERTYTTAQYKCVPFDKIRNVSADGTVLPTLESVIKTQQTVQQFQDAKRTAHDGFTSEQMEGIIAGTIIGVGAIVGIGYMMYYRTST